jgi:cytochrome c oxidase subunit I
MGFGLFATLHYWFPKMFGRMYDFRRATVAWVILFVGFNLFYMTMLILGWAGMPRRYYSYLPRFQTLQRIASIGSWIMASGLVLMFANLLHGLLRGAKAPDNPWGGATLEWQIPSPPTAEDFQETPTATRGPYDFRGPGAGG